MTCVCAHPKCIPGKQRDERNEPRENKELEETAQLVSVIPLHLAEGLQHSFGVRISSECALYLRECRPRGQPGKEKCHDQATDDPEQKVQHPGTKCLGKGGRSFRFARWLVTSENSTRSVDRGVDWGIDDLPCRTGLQIQDNFFQDLVLVRYSQLEVFLFNLFVHVVIQR